MAGMVKRRAHFWRSFVAVFVVLFLSGCQGNRAPVNLPKSNPTADVDGLVKLPEKNVWTYVRDRGDVFGAIPHGGTVEGGTFYQGGPGILELDMQTGKKILDVKWPPEHKVYCGEAPIVWQNRLYDTITEFDTQTASANQTVEWLACLDAATGSILWKSDVIGADVALGGNPLLLAGKLYCPAYLPDIIDSTEPEPDFPSAVDIFDAKTGQLTGRIPLPHGSYPEATQLVSDGASVYGSAFYDVSWGHCRSSIFRYDPSTAKTVWSVNYPVLPNDLINATYALAVDNGTLIVVSRVEESSYYADGTTTDLKPEYHMAAAFDTADGHELWSKSGLISSDTHLKSDQKPEIATRDGLAFLSIQDDGSLVALDERTGEEKWSLTVEKSRIESGPSIDGTPFYWYYNLIPMATANLLYVREGDSALLAVDPDTGTELWRKTLLTDYEMFEARDTISDAIPVSGGILVITCSWGGVRTLKLWQ